MTQNGHILVVDDNQANRDLVLGILVAAGYSATLAESGEEALAHFHARQPDMVLLDVMMPGWDGFETCEKIRQAPGGADTPIVFITGLSDLGSHQRAMSSGADDFLTKPINRTELLLRVRSLLWIKRLKTELHNGYDLIRSQRDALLNAHQQRAALTSLVVHDLKNPVSVILYNAEWLASGLSGEQAEAAQAIVSSAQSMHRMVMNLLDISRSEDGVLAPRISKLDLCGLARKTAAAQSPRDGRQKIEAACEPINIEGDADLLQRLLENLLDNAKKYSPPKSVIRVATEQIDSEWAELRVEDQGPGIPGEMREQIFEKYFRMEENVALHAGSSRGLGLTFCRLAAEVHGGRIWVDEGARGGSCFHLRLPISQARISIRPPEPVTESMKA